jgi:hypothetical protein
MCEYRCLSRLVEPSIFVERTRLSWVERSD